ncbi:glycine/D-amino acid oxidase-like deaminating enzyme [Roseibium hamelinense]|uniref:Glycine/D-amino acid oxidase-like deaminating enzyme n=1 Tax=Roseibium hamelinense TaxID=150831 RepID=A0A562SYE2_9HYPH|nr:FAD-binding oxidoreductase [Roseibium hamelinense]MTI44800.1 FAD-binding oxidoreductase [Roseibium hamelinense]TWI86008.1 glycine/D-amino acid oxidase-like deaminating enzyme [Roseibium hamelinense]
MNASLFTEDFKATPYWWDAHSPLEAKQTDLPAEADVVVIGSGYTGLNSALQTSRAGLSTLVLDAEALGWGCSTRNGGQVSTSVKPTYSELERRYGPQTAIAILQEGQASLDYMHELMRTEGLDCGFEEVGRFHGAHKPHLYDKLARDCEAGHKVWKTDAFMVPRADMANELGTDAYHGGMVFPHHCSIDVGKYHPALLRCVLSAGALIKSHCPVVSIERLSTGFRLSTRSGQVKAGKVILATNGYSGPLSRHHQRRIIPIGSYVIATEELDQDLVAKAFPTNRIWSDTRRLVYYYRLSPDRKRVLFGGRVSLSETDPRKSAVKLHHDLVDLFPELAKTRVSHSWMGFVGYTFDTLAHCAEDNGLFHAMGYCGSGVGMASYLGMRMGRKAAGFDKALSPLERISFPTRPLYSGNPWFLAPSVLVYRLRDRFGV